MGRKVALLAANARSSCAGRTVLDKRDERSHVQGARPLQHVSEIEVELLIEFDQRTAFERKVPGAGTETRRSIAAGGEQAADASGSMVQAVRRRTG